MTTLRTGQIAAFPAMRGRPSAVTAAPAAPTPAKTERIFPDAANTVSRMTTGRLSSVTAAMTALRTDQIAALPVMRGRPSAMTAVPAGPTRAKTGRISPDAASAVSRITTDRLFLVTAAMTTLRTGPSAVLSAMRDRPSAVTAVPADPTPAKAGRTSPDAENAVSPTTTDRLSIEGAALTTLRTGQSAVLSAMRGHFLTVSVIPEGRICGKTGQTAPRSENAASPAAAGRPSAVTPRRAVTLPAADTAGTAAPPLRQAMTAGAGTGSASPSRSAGLSMRRTSRIFSAGTSSMAATGTM